MSDFTWQFDPNLEESTTLVLNTAKFGDGYQQRYSTGLNNLAQEWAGSITRPTSVINEIVSFLKERSNGQSFTYTTPVGEVVKVVCSKWTLVWSSLYMCKITLTLERVYE